MPHGLKRYQQTGGLHFVTFSCYRRLPYLATPKAKTVVEQVLEHTRQTHTFDLHAYVLMPEHIHLLLSEPTRFDLATTLKVLKQESAKHLLGSREHLWQARYYDHNLRSESSRLQKIQYIHRNPVETWPRHPPRRLPVVQCRPLRHRNHHHTPPHQPLDQSRRAKDRCPIHGSLTAMSGPSTDRSTSPKLLLVPQGPEVVPLALNRTARHF